MAVPRKSTKTISLRNGQKFQWHLNPDWWFKGRFVAVRQEGLAGQILLLELFYYDFIPSQTAIRTAIRTAFRNGWEPGEKKKPLRLRYEEDGFIVADSKAAVAV